MAGYGNTARLPGGIADGPREPRTIRYGMIAPFLSETRCDPMRRLRIFAGSNRFSRLRLAKELLVHKGTVVLSALSPSDDQILMERILNWPTIRRTPARMLKPLEYRFVDIKTRALTAPAMLFSARRRHKNLVNPL